MIFDLKGVEDVLREGIFYAVLLDSTVIWLERYSFLANRLHDLTIHLF